MVHNSSFDGEAQRFGDGAPVLIFSNPQVDPAWWAEPYRRLLVDTGYQAIYVTPSGGAHPDAVVADVRHLIDSLGTDVAVIGWSQGAAIAQEVALACPDRVRGAVLLATYGRQNSMDALLQRAWRVLDREGDHLEPVRQALQAFQSFPVTELGDDTLARPLLAAAAEQAALSRPVSERRARAQAFIDTYQDRLDALAGVRTQCLVIGFELNADTFVARAREVAEAIPGARYVEVAGHGHLEPALQAEVILATVREFVLSVLSVATSAGGAEES